MNKTRKASWLLVLPALFLLAVAPGCGDDDDEVAALKAFIRILHLSPDAGDVDIWVDGAIQAVDDLGFLEGTDYLELDPGTYDFSITPFDDTTSVLDIDDVVLAAGTRYTVYAYDLAADLKAGLLVDDDSATAAGQFRARAIHAAEGVGEVDIRETALGLLLYDDVDFGVAGGYLDLDTMAYSIGFDLEDDGVSELVFSVPALDEGVYVNLFAVNDGADVYLVAQLPDGTIVVLEPAALLRVLHLSPDAGAVDILVDGAMAIDGLDFLEGTGYLLLDAGTYDFAVTPDDDNATIVLAIDDVVLAAGTRYTVFAYDFVGDLKANIIVDDATPLDPGTFRVRAIHAASGVGEVDIWEANLALLLYEDFDFTDVGDYLALDTMAYSIGFDLDNDAVVDLAIGVPELPAGSIVNLFAVNDGTEVFLAAQLFDGVVIPLTAGGDPPVCFVGSAF